MDLNEREVATLIWIMLLLAVFLVRPDTRKALVSVAVAFFNRGVIAVFLGMIIYTIIVVYGLYTIDLWSWNELKEVLIWSVAVGGVALFRLSTIEKEGLFFKHWVMDALKLVTVIEFIVSKYTLPIVAELLLIPIIFSIGGMVVVSKRESRYRLIAKVFDALLSLIGVMLVFYAFIMMVYDFEAFLSIKNAREFSTPIVLTVAFLPYLFAMHVFSSYQSVYVTLKFAVANDDLLKYAKLRCVLSFRFDTKLLKYWAQDLVVRPAQSRRDILDSIRDAKRTQYYQKRPVDVASNLGWVPITATKFLAEVGLETGRYHRSDDEWFASSRMMDVGEGLLPDSIAFYVKGSEFVVTHLKLTLNVNNPDSAEEALERFVEIGCILLRRAIKKTDIPLRNDEYEENVGQWKITLSKSIWSGGIPGGFSKTFTIETTRWSGRPNTVY